MWLRTVLSIFISLINFFVAFINLSLERKYTNKMEYPQRNSLVGWMVRNFLISPLAASHSKYPNVSLMQWIQGSRNVIRDFEGIGFTVSHTNWSKSKNCSRKNIIVDITLMCNISIQNCDAKALSWRHVLLLWSG